MKSTSGMRWLLAALVVLGLVGRAATGTAAYARIAYVALFLLVGGYVWSQLSLRGVRLKRDARLQRASMGEVFEEHFEISGAPWPGCLWLEVVNHSTLPMAAGSRLLTGIGARQRRFYSARTLLTRRGAFPLGPTTVASGDLFGLFPVQREFPADGTLVVLPMTVDIPTFPPPPGLLPGGKAIRQKTMDVTPHAAGIREYVPGDPMKRIHWPSTARRGRFMVKEFEQDPQADIWLFLDAQREVQAARPETPVTMTAEGFLLRRPKVTLPCDTFEYAVSAAASLARFFLAERRAVGLACAAGRFTVVSGERGERQMGKILETLAFLQPEGEMPLLGLVAMQAKLLPLGSGVVLITPAARPELLIAVEDLQRRSLRPVVVLLKTETFGGAGGAEAVAAGLLTRNVPVCQIGFGDDLGVDLSLPAVYFQRRYHPKSFFAAQA
jgi:uncharacterized protein (DUF58 family)